MICSIDLEPVLSRGHDYSIIDHFTSITGQWIVVRCNDGQIRHFHETRFGGKRAPCVDRFLSPSWLAQLSDQLS